MNADTIVKINSIIPEIWFDLIGRVIPGVVIVTLTAGVSGLSSNGWTVGLVIVYVVGFIFDVASKTLFKMSLERCWPEFFPEDYWYRLEKLPASSQPIVGKMMAEATMLRSFAFYLLLLALWMLLVGDPIPLEELRNRFQIHPLPLSLVFLGGVFTYCFACYIEIQQAGIKRLELLEKHMQDIKEPKKIL